MTKQTKKMPVFYTVLVSLILLAALLIGIVLNLLWDFLYCYESFLPKYVAREAFLEYFGDRNFQKLYELDIVKTGKFEGRSEFEEYMHSLLDGKELQHYELTTGNPEEKQYRVRTSEKRIGDIYLKKTGEQGGWGQEVWELSRIELAEPVTCGVKVKVISGSTLTLNGVKVGEEFVIERGIETPSCEHMPEGVTGMTYDVYEVTGLLATPEVACTDKTGMPADTYFDKQNGLYVENVTYDAAFAEAYSQLAIHSLQTYQRYLTNDANRTELREYLDKNSDFYKALMRTDTQWYAPHIAHEYSDEAVAEFYRYSDEVFSCRYVGTQIITRTKKDIRYFDIDCTLYFHLVNGEYKVYDIVFQ